MRIAFDLVAVHVGAGVALVGIADDVFGVGFGLGEEVPLVAGEKARAAAAAQTRGFDLLDDGVGAAIDEDLIERLIAADGDVLLDVGGADEAAVAENDFLLAFEEGQRVPERDLRIALAVAHVRGDVVPLFDFAVDEIGGECARGEAFENALGIVGVHAMQNHDGIAGKTDADDGLLKAGTEAADTGEQNVEAAALNGFVEGVKDLFRSVAAAAGAHAHGNARNGGRELGESGFAHRVEGANILNARHHFLPVPNLRQRFHFALQRALIYVAENVVVDFDNGRQRALAEAGHGAYGEAVIGGGELAILSASLFSSGSRSLRPRSRQSFSSRSREPRVWQAVPRQTQTHGRLGARD